MNSRKVPLGFSHSDGASKISVTISDWVSGGSLSMCGSTIASRSSRGIASNRRSITRTRSDAELYRYASTRSNDPLSWRLSSTIRDSSVRLLCQLDTCFVVMAIVLSPKCGLPRTCGACPSFPLDSFALSRIAHRSSNQSDAFALANSRVSTTSSARSSWSSVSGRCILAPGEIRLHVSGRFVSGVFSRINAPREHSTAYPATYCASRVMSAASSVSAAFNRCSATFRKSRLVFGCMAAWPYFGEFARRPRLYQNTIHLYIHSSHIYVNLSEIDWHSGWGGFPHEGNFVGGQAVGFGDEVAQLVLELEGFGGLDAGRFDGAGVLVAGLVLDFSLEQLNFVGRQIEQAKHSLVDLRFGIRKLLRDSIDFEVFLRKVRLPFIGCSRI